MNIFISPSNNCLLATAKYRFQLSLVNTRQKQIFENNNFVLLPNFISDIFTAFFKNKKNYHLLLKIYEIFSLVLDLASKEVEGGGVSLKGLGNLIL